MGRLQLWLILLMGIMAIIQTNLMLRLHSSCHDRSERKNLQQRPRQHKREMQYYDDEEEDDEPNESTAISTSLPQQGCRTTFHRREESSEQQQFLLFSAPSPHLTEVPEALLQWHSYLQEQTSRKGTLIVFINENQSLYHDHNIPTVCVEHTEEGLPRFDEMMRRMHEFQQGIVAFVNSDIWIKNQQSFEVLYDYLHTTLSTSFPVVKPLNLYKKFQPTNERTSSWFTVLTRTDIDERGVAQRHTAGGYDFWAWNHDARPLLQQQIPPFRFPFAAYDGWLLDMMIQASDGVATIDASQVADLYHYEHKRAGGNFTTWYQALSQGVTGVYMNKHLSYTTDIGRARHKWTFGTPLETPYYAVKNDQGEIEVLPRTYWSNMDEKTLLETTDCSKVRCTKIIEINKRTNDAKNSVQSLPVLHQRQTGGQLWKKVSENWRYVLDRQLKEHNKNGTVILTGATYAYRDHLRNFKCNMERVGANSHWIVAALDTEVYKWGIYQGFPMFLAAASSNDVAQPKKQRRMAGDEYGSLKFQMVTKLKSSAVLKVLEMGYSVVWSDLDIAWFDDPLTVLDSFITKGELGIQSNAPYVQTGTSAQPHPTVDMVRTENPAAYRRLNSGLYVAPNTPMVRQAFRDIVAHAKTSDKTEQPSFDEILCNINGSRRYKTYCVYEREGESLFVRILNRFQFVHGAVLVSESNRNVFDLGRDFEVQTGVPLVAAHNNWIRGKENKLERHRNAGWWYAKDENSCVYPGDVSSDLLEGVGFSDDEDLVI